MATHLSLRLPWHDRGWDGHVCDHPVIASYEPGERWAWCYVDQAEVDVPEEAVPYLRLHQGRARTCTRNPQVRLLLVGMALVLCDVWVWLHYAILSTPRRGGRRLDIPPRIDLGPIAARSRSRHGFASLHGS